MLARHQWRLPKRAGIAAAALFLSATAAAGIVAGGHAMTVASAATAWSGLAIQNVEITGQSEASELDILDRLAIGSFPSLLTFDVDAARERVEGLPWVEVATLTKLFPGTLKVEIGERQPFAAWQNDGQVFLVDELGGVIAEAAPGRYTDLPHVTGEGAGTRIGEFLSLVGSQPQIYRRVSAGVLVSGRRWNVVLDNGVELLLPADRPEAALADIASLDRDTRLLSREVAAVDFRFEDRLFVRLTEAGAAGREELLKQRAREGGA